MRNIKKIKTIKELGFLGAISLITRRLYGWFQYRFLRFRWNFFRLKHKDFHSTIQPALASNREEEIMRLILVQSKGQSFLEIGIGRYPNIERLRLISQSDIRYTGCDFKDVCDIHTGIIKENNDIYSDNIRFLSNHVGTYSWTLFELLRRDEKFDIIYLDGHHTFYVDLPALLLAHFLLKPGGIFLLDDIQWTLKLLKKHLVTYLGSWDFYRKMYDFSPYDEDQQSLPHIGMMAETILLDRLEYSKIDVYSTPAWWALRKPLNA